MPFAHSSTKTISVQVNPSPVCVTGQVQVKPKTLSVQVATASQGLSKHSLTSLNSAPPYLQRTGKYSAVFLCVQEVSTGGHRALLGFVPVYIALYIAFSRNQVFCELRV